MTFFPPIYVRGPKPPHRPWVERKPRVPTDEEVRAELLLWRHLEAADAMGVDTAHGSLDLDLEEDVDAGRFDDERAPGATP